MVGELTRGADGCAAKVSGFWVERGFPVGLVSGVLVDIVAPGEVDVGTILDVSISTVGVVQAANNNTNIPIKKYLNNFIALLSMDA
jgi:hypothetical protein